MNFEFLITMFVLITMSCQNPDKKQYTISNAIQSQSVIDTSLWLKETRGIRDILEDRRGNLWFSSPDYVAKFDGQSMYYFSKNDGLSITGNIQEDNNGIVWIENGIRAFKYDGVSFSEERIDNIKGSNGLWIQRGLKSTDTTYVKPGLYEVKQFITNECGTQVETKEIEIFGIESFTPTDGGPGDIFIDFYGWGFDEVTKASLIFNGVKYDYNVYGYDRNMRGRRRVPNLP
mgnify:CR=1 FL=1